MTALAFRVDPDVEDLPRVGRLPAPSCCFADCERPLTAMELLDAPPSALLVACGSCRQMLRAHQVDPDPPAAAAQPRHAPRCPSCDGPTNPFTGECRCSD